MKGTYESLILIVDDNPENIKVLANILENEKYPIAIAMNGKDAFDFLKQEKPELILLDIMMPEINGYQLCKRIKKDARFKDIPVIFLTAKRETEDIVHGFDIGGVDYITKPFNSKELLVRVKTHLELKHTREEIKTLRGFLSVCANCKKVKNEKGKWENFESFVHEHSEAEITHGLCPDCAKKLYPDIKITDL